MEKEIINPKQVLDISKLPIGIRKELLDFYEFLVQKYEKGSSMKQRTQTSIQDLFGKYRHIETSSDFFAKSKQSEKDLEI